MAGRHLGWLTYEEYVDWAVGCLESGLDSKNIRILALLRKPPDTYSELSGAAWDTAIIQEAQRFISEGSSFDLEDSSL